MALDGVTVCAAACELRHFLTDGYISKIAEPEKDELMMAVKTQEYGVKRLLISVGSSMPFVCLTETNKPSPATAPAFTMLLRKRLMGGRILAIEQPSLERIIRIVAEHRDELGDLVKRNLIIEMMGKYSNIILTDENDVIIDAIRRVPPSMSSVRTVLPGERYYIAPTQDKADPFRDTDRDYFRNHILGRPMSAIKALYSTYTGFSPVMAAELCHRAGIDGDESSASLAEEDISRLYDCFTGLMSDLKEGSFAPEIVYEDGAPREFAAIHLSMYEDSKSTRYEWISGAVEDFYSRRNAYNHIRQKSANLRKTVSNAIERTAKKHDLQMSQVKDTDKMDRYRVYAELINTYGYGVEDGAEYFDTVNFYDGKEIRVPLDPSISVHENANRYFARFDKLKRTREAAARQAEESEAELRHLKSIEASFETADTEDDLALIAEELRRTGYIKKGGAPVNSGRASKGGASRTATKSRPLHYVSSDGYDIYVGKNNIQNDELTFRQGKGNDWWFHSKKFPGSHVLLVTKERDPMKVPDRTFNEAGRIAAYYSTGRDQSKVDIDYTLLKNVKKPAGAVPGYVIYHTNYSMSTEADISGIDEAE